MADAATKSKKGNRLSNISGDMNNSTVNSTKESRRPNFSTAEKDALLNAYLDRKALLGNHSSEPQFKKKIEVAWKEIADAVNAVSTTIRTVAELQKKASNLKSEFKKRESKRRADRRQTGGGENEVDQHVTNEDQLLSQIVPQEMIDGIVPVDDDVNSIRAPEFNQDEINDDFGTAVNFVDSNDQVEAAVDQDQLLSETADGSLPKTASASKIASKRVAKRGLVEEFVRAEHEEKMEILEIQKKSARIEHEAAQAKKMYWEKKIQEDFFNGETVYFG